MTHVTSIYPPIRRVVTGHDENGVAKVLLDGPACNSKTPLPLTTTTLIWSTDAAPASIPMGLDAEDMGSRVLGTAPPPRGTRFCIIDIPANNKSVMHRTETLDYVLVLSGQIDMELDDSCVHLEAGDVLIQRGTNHEWVNRGTGPARVAFVLIDAEPLGIGQPVIGSHTAGDSIAS